jgi:hypothetical protein
MPEYKRISDGEPIDFDWRRGEELSISCCECGLVHIFRAVASKDKIRVRIYRDDKATEEERIKRNIKVEKL